MKKMKGDTKCIYNVTEDSYKCGSLYFILHFRNSTISTIATPRQLAVITEHA